MDGYKRTRRRQAVWRGASALGRAFWQLNRRAWWRCSCSPPGGAMMPLARACPPAPMAAASPGIAMVSERRRPSTT